MPEGSVHGKTFMLWLSIPLAAGMVIAAAIASDAYLKAKSPHRTVSVKGLAERSVISDTVTWSCSVSVRNIDLKGAYSDLERCSEKVYSFLQAKGIKKELVEISSVNMRTIYKKTSKTADDDGESGRKDSVDSYALNRSFSIKISDVKLVSSIAVEITSLIKDGVDISSRNPHYYCSVIKNVKLELLEEAVTNAEERAACLIGKNGKNKFSVISAQQGIFQITSPDSTSVSDYGEYDTSSIEKRVRSVVTMEYLVENDGR